MRPEIEVVLVPVAAPVEVIGPTGSRLGDALRRQGLEATLSRPAGLRELADLVAGPTAQVPLAPIALIGAAVVVNAPALGAVLDDPRLGSAALAAPADGGGLAVLGVLRLAAGDRAVAARSLRAASAPTDREPLTGLVHDLVAAGVDVQPVPLGGYAWARPGTPAELATALAAIDAVDERSVRLRAAARGGDGFYSTFVLRRLSWRLTGLAERAGLSPNQVTLASFGLGLAGAGLLATGGRWWSVAGAVLLQLCLLLDCVDGELARYRRRFSRSGAWLDATTDRVKEFAVIGALGVAAARSGHPLWGLVAVAITVQTFRNLVDLGWARWRGAAPLAAPAWVSPPSRSWPAGGGWGGAAVGRVGWVGWLRRVGHFPIGERFLLISVGTASGTAAGTAVALVAVGLVSALYMLTAFVVRGRRPRVGAGADPLDLLDAGPLLGRLLHRVPPRPAVALLPATMAATELLLVLWLAAVAGAAGWAATLLVAAVAVAHYEWAYAVREGVSWGARAVGADIRLPALAVAVTGPAVVLPAPVAGWWATGGTVTLAVLVAAGSLTRSARSFIGGPEPEARPRRSGQPGPAVRGVPARLRSRPTGSVQKMSVDAGCAPSPRPAAGGAR